MKLFFWPVHLLAFFVLLLGVISTGCTTYYDEEVVRLTKQNEILDQRRKANDAQLSAARSRLSASMAELSELERQLHAARDTRKYMTSQRQRFYQTREDVLYHRNVLLRLGTDLSYGQVLNLPEGTSQEQEIPLRLEFYGKEVPQREIELPRPERGKKDLRDRTDEVKDFSTNEVMSNFHYRRAVVAPYSICQETAPGRLTTASVTPIPFGEKTVLFEELPLRNDQEQYWIIADTTTASVVPFRFEVHKLEILLQKELRIVDDNPKFIGIIAWETGSDGKARTLGGKIVAVDQEDLAQENGHLVVDVTLGKPFVLEKGQHWALIIPPGTEIPYIWSNQGDFHWATIAQPEEKSEIIAWNNNNDLEFVGQPNYLQSMNYPEWNLSFEQIKESIILWTPDASEDGIGMDNKSSEVTKFQDDCLEWQNLKRCACFSILGVPVEDEEKSEEGQQK